MQLRLSTYPFKLNFEVLNGLVGLQSQLGQLDPLVLSQLVHFTLQRLEVGYHGFPFLGEHSKRMF